ncbi:MAG: YitT family protein [Eubacteriales bacterium]
MEQKSPRELAQTVVLIIFGSMLYAAGFDLFLKPNDINLGGLTGIGLLLTVVTPLESIGSFVIVMNIPLFILAYRHVGRGFFMGSLVGMLTSSIMVDVFAHLDGIQSEPLMACIFGGIMIGVGMGIVFKQGASTGGTDIVGRLVKKKFPYLPMGKAMFFSDAVVLVATGIVFQDVNKMMYSAVALFVITTVMDVIIYGQNNCGVAMIVSDKAEELSAQIVDQLGRGVTLLNGKGVYTGQAKQVIMCAVKNQQVGQLEALAVAIDPKAFVIMQKAHQVLGDGFGRYREDGMG